ncbi:MAG: hypothetical protein IJ660_04520 [Alphaproteobacteria bacterium]|nr:hypothetical protein [Alphaproteobacteria bacterium]
MINKEKLILYIWLFSLFFIILLGVIFSFKRPPSEIIAADKELIKMTEKVRMYYRNRPDYWGLNNTVAIEQKFYQGELKDNKIFNTLGKEVVIGADGDGTQVMPGARSFVITYRELDKKECIELAIFQGKEQDKLGLISMSIQNDKGTYDFSWGNKGLPLSRKQAKQYCQEKNNIMWSFE